jgi:RNA polymerase sigma-70 factor (ECF subfamily)
MDVTTGSTDMRFRRLFDEAYEPVHRYCLRRLSPSDANDATAETFVIAWRRIDDVPVGEDAVAYLFGIARNVVRNTRRSNRRSQRLRSKLADEPAAASAPADRMLIRNEEDRLLLEALATLSDEDQEILRLKTYEGLDSRQISVVLGCSHAAARKRLSRATARLRTAVGPAIGLYDSRVIERGGDG